MPKPVDIAIIAALKRELAPLLGDWTASEMVHLPSGVCFEKGSNLAIAGGIGPRAARRAAESLLEAATPKLLVSAGMAGALTPAHCVGDVFIPNVVISDTGEDFFTGVGTGTLLTVPGVTGMDSKRDLGNRFAAEAVDMEAAAVAQIAKRHGVPFVAIKAISDELDFPMPDMSDYVTADGSFDTGRLVAHAILHPRMWGVLSRLKTNSARAACRLCLALHALIEGGISAVSASEFSMNSGPSN
jgi:adenosylhomocysteine nucleosidase